MTETHLARMTMKAWGDEATKWTPTEIPVMDDQGRVFLVPGFANEPAPETALSEAYKQAQRRKANPHTI